MYKDLILDANNALVYEDVFGYINEPALTWWKALNTFIQQKYHVSPKVSYSKCTAQKGWNIKYQISGKSLCTLYPEKESFIILIVIKLELVEFIESMASSYDPSVMKIVRNARPFNGTKWLMIRVESEAIMKNVRDLLVFKLEMSTSKKTAKP